MIAEPSDLQNHPLILLFDQPESRVKQLLNNAFYLLSNLGVDLQRFGIENFQYEFADLTLEFSPENVLFCETSPSAITCGLKVYTMSASALENQTNRIERAALAEAAALGEALGAVAIYWRPAKLLSGFSFFLKSMKDMHDYGRFPIFSTVYFDADNPGIITTLGLIWFCEQELEFHFDGLTPGAALAQCVKLADKMIQKGPFFQHSDALSFDNDCQFISMPGTDRLVVLAAPQRNATISMH